MLHKLLLWLLTVTLLLFALSRKGEKIASLMLSGIWEYSLWPPSGKKQWLRKKVELSLGKHGAKGGRVKGRNTLCPLPFHSDLLPLSSIGWTQLETSWSLSLGFVVHMGSACCINSTWQKRVGNESAAEGGHRRVFSIYSIGEKVSLLNHYVKMETYFTTRKRCLECHLLWKPRQMWLAISVC